MGLTEQTRQQALHEAIEASLDSDAGLLIGWIVIFETAPLSPEDRASCGHFYGPHEMTTWRALGLVEWARRATLEPDPPEEDA